METYVGGQTARNRGGRLTYRTGGGWSADRPPEVSLLFGTLTLMSRLESRLESRLNVSVRFGAKAGFV